MDKIVVDSSVVVKWFVTEPLSAESHRILDSYQSGAITLLAPDLLNAEVGNIIWKKHRFQGLAKTDAEQVIAAFRELTIEFTPTAELVEDAFRIAVEHERTVYDSLYVALSEREKCPFVSADERLVNAISKSFPSAMWVANWSA